MTGTTTLPRPVGLSLLSLVLLAGQAADGADWPSFRGPNDNGVSTAVGVPVEWAPEQNVTWKSAVAGKGWSSPALHDGRIYLTTAVGSPEEGGVSLRVVALEAEGGQTLWDVEALRPSDDLVGQMHQKNSLASPTALVEGGRIYAHFGHMGTVALDLTGKVLWTQTDLAYPPMHGTGSSPVLVDGLLVMSCDGSEDPFLVALDSETGAVRWKTPRSESTAQRSFSFATPTVIDLDGQKQIISPASGYVAAYNPADGAELWRVGYGDGFSVVPRPVYAGGLLYVCTGYMRPSLLAIDPTGATGDATESHLVWRYDQGAPNSPSVLVADGLVFMVSDRGVATCLDARSGEEQWTQRLGGGFSSSPIAAGGNVYFQNEEGVTYVVRAASTYEPVAENDLEERTLASPAVDDGVLFLRTESHLWRIENRVSL